MTRITAASRSAKLATNRDLGSSLWALRTQTNRRFGGAQSTLADRWTHRGGIAT